MLSMLRGDHQVCRVKTGAPKQALLPVQDVPRHEECGHCLDIAECCHGKLPWPAQDFQVWLPDGQAQANCNPTYKWKGCEMA
jgi:hypothetical protein